MIGGARLLEAHGNSRCRYDLPAAREMMRYLTDHSEPGDVVFTDDWDVFPLYFFHNTLNRYVVGLDPKFTHDRRPDLWDRYVKITRGQTPTTIRTGVNGSEPEPIEVRLEDIRDHFEAGFIITDRDHGPLNRQLDGAWEFCELLWPKRDAVARSPYRLYRVLGQDEVAGPRPRAITQPKIVYLSDLTPIQTEPADVHWCRDRALDGGPLKVRARTHLRGVSAATPAVLHYEIPRGATHFESTVCFKQAASDAASVLILVDGEPRQAAHPANGNDTAHVSVSVLKGDRIELRATDSADATPYEVTWASARFVVNGTN
jgi:hypothetical protein